VLPESFLYSYSYSKFVGNSLMLMAAVNGVASYSVVLVQVIGVDWYSTSYAGPCLSCMPSNGVSVSILGADHLSETVSLCPGFHPRAVLRCIAAPLSLTTDQQSSVDQTRDHGLMSTDGMPAGSPGLYSGRFASETGVPPH